jgi:hypothetical protein
VVVDLSGVSILARGEDEARILGPVIKALIHEMGPETTLQFVGRIIQAVARESGA